MSVSQKNAIKEYSASILFILPSFILLLLFVVQPTINTVLISFYEWNGINPTMEFVGLDNYRAVFSDPVFHRSITNNFIWMMMHLIFACLFGFIIAYIVSRVRVGRAIFRNVLFLPYIIALAISAVIWSLIYHPHIGLLNSLLEIMGLPGLRRAWLGDPVITIYAVSIASSWQAYGYYMTLFLAGIQNVDVELYDAASIDGAGKIKQLIHVTIPGLRNVFTFVVSMGIIAGLRGFATVWIMTRGGPGTSSYLLTLYGFVKAFVEQNFGQSMVSGLTLALMIVVIIFTFNHIRERYAD